MKAGLSVNREEEALGAGALPCGEGKKNREAREIAKSCLAV